MNADFDAAVPGLAQPEGVDDALREAGACRAALARAMAALMRLVAPPADVDDDADMAAYVQVTGSAAWASMP